MLPSAGRIVTHRVWPHGNHLNSMRSRIPFGRTVRKTDPKVLFGKHLATLRKQRNWSQEQLALESGLARSYVGGVERGQRNVSLVNICRLADTLSLPPSKLLEFDR